MNRATRAFIMMMAAAFAISGAKASSITVAEAITDTADSAKITLIVEKGKPSGNYETGSQVIVTADAAPPGAKFASWAGDVEILANPLLAITTATIPFMAVKITATYIESETTVETSEPSPTASQATGAVTTTAPETNRATESGSASANDRSWGG